MRVVFCLVGPRAREGLFVLSFGFLLDGYLRYIFNVVVHIHNSRLLSSPILR